MNNKSLVLINTCSLLIMLVANYGFNTGVFSSASVADISRKYDTLFTPAGYAFSIWSVIFLLLIGFVIYQWLLLKENDSKQYIKRTGLWFTLSNLANTAWLYCWTNDKISLSVVCILILLLSLIVLPIKLRLELDDEPVRIIFFVWWPIAIYLGWIMVATIANIAAFLVSIGWKGGAISDEGWTISMIVIPALLFLILLVKRNLRESAAVGIWAFIAIAVRQYNNHSSITVTAAITAIILFVAISLHAFKNRNYSILNKIKKGEWK